MAKHSLEQFAQFYPGESVYLPSDISKSGEELASLKLQIANILFAGELENDQTFDFGNFSQALKEFPCLLANISVKAVDFVESFRDQVAAGELLTRFGVPESLLAVPVFTNLMSREVLSKLEASRAAEDVNKYLISIKQWVAKFLCLLKIQSIAIENELIDHQLAGTKLSQVEATGQFVIRTKTEFQEKLTKKVGSLFQKQKQTHQAMLALWQMLQSLELASHPIARINHQSSVPSIMG